MSNCQEFVFETTRVVLHSVSFVFVGVFFKLCSPVEFPLNAFLSGQLRNEAKVRLCCEHLPGGHVAPANVAAVQRCESEGDVLWFGYLPPQPHSPS